MQYFGRFHCLVDLIPSSGPCLCSSSEFRDVVYIRRAHCRPVCLIPSSAGSVVFQTPSFPIRSSTQDWTPSLILRYWNAALQLRRFPETTQIFLSCQSPTSERLRKACASVDGKCAFWHKLGVVPEGQKVWRLLTPQVRFVQLTWRTWAPMDWNLAYHKIWVAETYRHAVQWTWLVSIVRLERCVRLRVRRAGFFQHTSSGPRCFWFVTCQFKTVRHFISVCAGDGNAWDTLDSE
jgi:hypothetical protein